MNWLFKQDGLNIDRKVANENMNEAKHKFDLGALNLRIQTRQQKPADMNMNYKPRVIENIQLGRNIRTDIPDMKHIHKTHLDLKEMNKETNMFGFDMHQRRVKNKTFQSYNGVSSNMLGIPKSVDKFMSSGKLRTYEGRMAGREDINGKVKTNQEILLENWRKDPKFQAILATKGKSAPTPSIPTPAPAPAPAPPTAVATPTSVAPYTPLPPSTNTSPNTSPNTSTKASTKTSAVVNIVSPLVNSNDDSKKKVINSNSSVVTLAQQKKAFEQEIKGNTFTTPKQSSQKSQKSQKNIVIDDRYEQLQEIIEELKVYREKEKEKEKFNKVTTKEEVEEAKIKWNKKVDIKQGGMSLEDEIINEMGDIYEDSEKEEDDHKPTKSTKKDKIDVSNMTEADVEK